MVKKSIEQKEIQLIKEYSDDEIEGGNLRAGNKSNSKKFSISDFKKKHNIKSKTKKTKKGKGLKGGADDSNEASTSSEPQKSIHNLSDKVIEKLDKSGVWEPQEIKEYDTLIGKHKSLYDVLTKLKQSNEIKYKALLEEEHKNPSVNQLKFHLESRQKHKEKDNHNVITELPPDLQASLKPNEQTPKLNKKKLEKKTPMMTKIGLQYEPTPIIYELGEEANEIPEITEPDDENLGEIYDKFGIYDSNFGKVVNEKEIEEIPYISKTREHKKFKEVMEKFHPLSEEDVKKKYLEVLQKEDDLLFKHPKIGKEQQNYLDKKRSVIHERVRNHFLNQGAPTDIKDYSLGQLREYGRYMQKEYEQFLRNFKLNNKKVAKIIRDEFKISDDNASAAIEQFYDVNDELLDNTHFRVMVEKPTLKNIEKFVSSMEKHKPKYFGKKSTKIQSELGAFRTYQQVLKSLGDYVGTEKHIAKHSISIDEEIQALVNELNNLKRYKVPNKKQKEGIKYITKRLAHLDKNYYKSAQLQETINEPYTPLHMEKNIKYGPKLESASVPLPPSVKVSDIADEELKKIYRIITGEYIDIDNLSDMQKNLLKVSFYNQKRNLLDTGDKTVDNLARYLASMNTSEKQRKIDKILNNKKISEYVYKYNLEPPVTRPFEPKKMDPFQINKFDRDFKAQQNNISNLDGFVSSKQALRLKKVRKGVVSNSKQNMDNNNRVVQPIVESLTYNNEKKLIPKKVAFIEKLDDKPELLANLPKKKVRTFKEGTEKAFTDATIQVQKLQKASDSKPFLSSDYDNKPRMRNSKRISVKQPAVSINYKQPKIEHFNYPLGDILNKEDQRKYDIVMSNLKKLGDIIPNVINKEKQLKKAAEKKRLLKDIQELIKLRNYYLSVQDMFTVKYN